MDCSNCGSCSPEESSLSCLLQQCSDLNEDGVYELASGRSMEAVQFFQEALDVLMEASKYLLSDDEHQAHYPATGRVQIPHLQDDLFYIYPCAVTVYLPSATSTASSSCSNLQGSHPFHCAVVLFNLALAYHQQGKKIKKEGMLSKALEYYKECQHALQSLFTYTGEDQDQDDLILLTLAVMNNQAHIEYELLMQDNASTVAGNCTESFQKLWQYSLQAMLLAQDRDGTNFSMVEQSQIHEFVQNAMVFRLDRPCAAPTA